MADARTLQKQTQELVHPGYPGSSTDIAGATNSAGAPGMWPIDTTGLPEEFPEPLCEGPLRSLHLALPCKVGMPLGGAAGVSIVECYDTSGRTALSFTIDLAVAARWIGRPRSLKGNAPVEPPLAQGPAVSIAVEGVQYTGVFKGSLTLQQVDPTGRAFVAFLTREFVAWKDPEGTETDCDLDPMGAVGHRG